MKPLFDVLASIEADYLAVLIVIFLGGFLGGMIAAAEFFRGITQ